MRRLSHFLLAYLLCCLEQVGEFSASFYPDQKHQAEYYLWVKLKGDGLAMFI